MNERHGFAQAKIEATTYCVGYFLAVNTFIHDRVEVSGRRTSFYWQAGPLRPSSPLFPKIISSRVPSATISWKVPLVTSSVSWIHIWCPTLSEPATIGKIQPLHFDGSSDLAWTPSSERVYEPLLPGNIVNPHPGGIALHGGFEGDASLTRADAFIGDNHNLQDIIYDLDLLQLGKFGDNGPDGNNTVLNVVMMIGIKQQNLSSFFRNQTFPKNWFRAATSVSGSEFAGQTFAGVSGIVPGRNSKQGVYVANPSSLALFNASTMMLFPFGPNLNAVTSSNFKLLGSNLPRQMASNPAKFIKLLSQERELTLVMIPRVVKLL
ncbi:hypothetical protein DFH08DRAFT_811478 [Mycena albidolilacea]|uniref:Uncharacterized protein n=1 Tax=Mycena albidolilacea TaxID=1033008 RepID=A0AAD6ZVJ9_9AGAR|nr:hypothetical protein DFH08DRAFT_811478 [Mycena albidolilacea]